MVHSSASKRPLVHHVIRAGIFVLAIAAAVVFVRLLTNMDWSVVDRASGKALTEILILTILETLTYTTMICWLLRRSGGKASLWNSYLVLTASLSASYVAAMQVGVPLRIYLYHRVMNVSAHMGTALMAVEYFAGTMASAFIATMTIPFLFPAVGIFVPGLLISVLLLAAGTFYLIQPDQLLSLQNRLGRYRRIAACVHFTHRVRAGLGQLSALTTTGAVGFFVIMLVLQAMRLELVLRIFGHAPPVLTLLGVLTIAGTLGNASMLPMGIGVRDASFVFLLLQLGLSHEVAISAAVIQRLFAPGWPLLLGLISAQLLGVKALLKNRRDDRYLVSSANDPVVNHRVRGK